MANTPGGGAVILGVSNDGARIGNESSMQTGSGTASGSSRPGNSRSPCGKKASASAVF